MITPKPIFNHKKKSKALLDNGIHDAKQKFMAHTEVHGTSVIYTNDIARF